MGWVILIGVICYIVISLYNSEVNRDIVNNLIKSNKEKINNELRNKLI